jgi:hypothetical protein
MKKRNCLVPRKFGTMVPNQLPVCRKSQVLICTVSRTMRCTKQPVVSCKQPIDRIRKMWPIDRHRKLQIDRHCKLPIDRHRKLPIDQHRKMWPIDRHHKRPIDRNHKLLIDRHRKRLTDRHCKWVTGSHKSWPDRRYKPPKSAGRRKLQLESIRMLVAAGRTAGWRVLLRHRWKQPPEPRRIDRWRLEPLRRIGKLRRLLVRPLHRNPRSEHNRRHKNRNHWLYSVYRLVSLLVCPLLLL